MKERGGLNKDLPITAYLRRKYPGFSDEEIKLLENLWRFDRVMYNAFMENENNKNQLLADGNYQYIGAGVYEHKGISYWCILLYK